jgi:LacI family transcriptional regulator
VPKKSSPALETGANIRMIAETLGVSIGTVDRALHNRGRISEKTRARILQTAQDLGYKPNLAARHLRLNRRFRISVNLPFTIASFFDRLREGVQEGAMPFGHSLAVEFRSYERTDEEPQSSVEEALDDHVDGIILAPSNTQRTIRLMEEAQAKGVSIICVATDVPESARLAAVTAHPFSCGAMSAQVIGDAAQPSGPIAVLVGNIENYNQSEKLRGFRQTLAELSPGHSIGPVLESRDIPELAYKQVRNAFQRNKNLRGLYVSTANSVPAIRALRDIGKLSQVAIVTTDLFPELVPLIRDGIVKATIYQCPKMQGNIAARTLFQYLANGTVPESSIEVIPQLILRSNLPLYIKTNPAMTAVQIP